jgi:hypothetical protein
MDAKILALFLGGFGREILGTGVGVVIDPAIEAGPAFPCRYWIIRANGSDGLIA